MSIRLVKTCSFVAQNWCHVAHLVHGLLVGSILHKHKHDGYGFWSSGMHQRGAFELILVCIRTLHNHRNRNLRPISRRAACPFKAKWFSNHSWQRRRLKTASTASVNTPRPSAHHAPHLWIPCLLRFPAADAWSQFDQVQRPNPAPSIPSVFGYHSVDTTQQKFKQIFCLTNKMTRETSRKTRLFNKHIGIIKKPIHMMETWESRHAQWSWIGYRRLPREASAAFCYDLGSERPIPGWIRIDANLRDEIDDASIIFQDTGSWIRSNPHW